MIKRIFPYLIVLVISLGSIQPLFSPGFFPMHDDTQVARVTAMGRALRNGQLPVRWVADLGYGYGYPLFNFYGPLPYYAGGLLYALGVSGLTATKIMFVLGIIGAGISMYLFTREVFGSQAGLVAAVAYMYAPYHAVQIYVRGAVGEFWALVFFPLVLLGYVHIVGNKRVRKGVFIGSIGIAGAILSHTIAGYITVLMSVSTLAIATFYSLVNSPTRHGFLYRNLWGMVCLGIGLSAFFWLPALVEMGYTNVSGQIGATALWRDHFVCLGQLWQSPWGYGGSSAGCTDGMSFKLGKVQIILGALGLVSALWYWRRQRLGGSVFMVMGLLTIGSLLFLLPVSSPVWQIIPMFSFVQYPWRFLMYTMFGLSFFVAATISIIQKRPQRYLVSAIFIILLVSVNSKLFQPHYLYGRDWKEFESDEELHYRVSKISDEYLPGDVVRPASPGQVPTSPFSGSISGRVEVEIDTETITKSHMMFNKPEVIRFNRTHFPGWHYYLDGKEVSAGLVGGLPTFSIPDGTHVFEARFSDTPVRTLGNILSLAAAAVLVGLLIQYEKKDVR